MSERLLVTSALPYANGPIHLGHMVEHVQTDVYVRFRRAAGDDVTWICAADAHGTPIEVNAAKAGMAPADFAEKYRAEHRRTFAAFGISHDTYYTTHSPENQRWANRIYDALKARGLVARRAVEQLYCERDRRFLPDRFVKGTCPRCGTPDQYGDVCESCGTTYDPRDLIGPACALCGSVPVVRASEHAYVNLREPRVFAVIRDWVEAEGHLFPAVRHQVSGWLADLQDWCITRDAPYFGFPVPDADFPGKFLYVWVDAPIGYLSSGEHHFAAEVPEGRRLTPADFERRYLAEGAPARLEHFIGKDILRFHAVFWPAMLWAAGVKRPDRLSVHGFLTVNGEKMSKSRGTFINADTYLQAGLDPELLRYFFAASLGPGPGDLDLSLEEFRNRVNADLANNVANLASRVAALLERLGGPLRAEPEPALAEAAREALRGARRAYLALEHREAVRLATGLASLANRRMQEVRPWEEPGAAGSRATLFGAAKALRAAAVILWPVMPGFAGRLAAAFGQPDPARWPEDLDAFGGPPVEVKGKAPQIPRLDGKRVARLILPAGEGPAEVPAAAGRVEAASPAAAPPAGVPQVIGYDDFARVDLRVAAVLSAEPVPKADKLLKLTVDVGEGSPRTIVAGIARSYPDPAALVGRRIVVVANLEPRPLRGIVSQGMLLAAGEPPDVQVVAVGDAVPPGTRVK
ncbi:MAG TPA: methionine--tRNA ligase [Anaeromyxobacteraceae bacterium]